MKSKSRKLVVATVKEVSRLAQQGKLTDYEMAQLLLQVEILGTLRAIVKEVRGA